MDDPATEKKCARCRETKPLEAFSAHRRYRDGRQSYCRACMRDYRLENKERINARIRGRRREDTSKPFAAYLARKYNLTADAYAKLLADQDGRCAVCRTAETGGERGGRALRLHVDHDHKCCPGAQSCGKCVRGLLCSRCNFGIGQFDDNPSALKAALTYLEIYA